MIIRDDDEERLTRIEHLLQQIGDEHKPAVTLAKATIESHRAVEKSRADREARAAARLKKSDR